MNSLKEECGVFGIYSNSFDVSKKTFYGIYALQHRGQESAGIATSDGNKFKFKKGMGLVTQVFKEKNLSKLKGRISIGHTRYSTTGESSEENIQPYILETFHGPIGLVHNGNIINSNDLKNKILLNGYGLTSTSDTELLMHLLLSYNENKGINESWIEKIYYLMEKVKGAYSLILMTKSSLYAIRDPNGFRPLSIGIANNSEYVISSETCAFETIGAKHLRDIEPGEIVKVSKNGIKSFKKFCNIEKESFCIFEYIYFARPDSYLQNKSIHDIREKFGIQLAIESPVEADIIIGVPDSSLSSAIGYSIESEIPYRIGLIKNRYIGRTFIQPDNTDRKKMVDLKFNALPSVLKDKKVIVVDDSIVRGNTAGPLVQLIREAGAKEVHLRISSPPVKYPCYMGVNISKNDNLIACNMSIKEMEKYFNIDSLAYLSIERIIETMKNYNNCDACFTGNYPLNID